MANSVTLYFRQTMLVVNVLTHRFFLQLQLEACGPLQLVVWLSRLIHCCFLHMVVCISKELACM